MQGQETYDQYPAGTVIVSNILAIAIWAIGIYLLYLVLPLLVIPYILIILFLEYRLIARHCVDCHYYGKTCAFGKGRISSLLFRKGDPERFCSMTIPWKDIIPGFLLFVIPALAGIGLLLMAFSPLLLILTIALFLLGFFGNALVRGRLACSHCRQRGIGCPAAQFFNKRTG